MSTAPRPLIQSIQDSLARLLCCGVETRTTIVAGMLHRNPTEATSYWLQLIVSIGIATLGLVLGSTAAVIGAMLVAPLMGPIIGLAMGLSTGSPFLVLRSAGRVAASTVIVVLGAAGITLILPFHELNSEIAARTTPTALDLATAAFCALAGVYATLRPGSDTTTTAAGTSISISLVPPLCASGYGVGTSAWPVASGAALLFLTNFVAIVVVGTVSFLAAGFNRVGVRELEHQELQTTGDAPVSRAIARALEHLLGSRSAVGLRIFMPFLLLAIVYVPLRRALNEVAWEVQAKAVARTAIANLKQPIVQSRVRVERHRVDVAVVLLGKSPEADLVRDQLDRELRPAVGVVPRIEVLAIPDAQSFAGLESTLLSSATQPPVPPSPVQTLQESRQFLQTAVEKYFPTDTAGPLLLVEASAAGTPMLVGITHQGQPLAASASEILSRSVSAEVGRPVRVLARALPDKPLTRGSDDYAFLSSLSANLRDSERVDNIAVCVVHPPAPPPWRPSAARDKAFAASVLALLGERKNVVFENGAEWSIRFQRGPCLAQTAAQDAGADAVAPPASQDAGGVDAGG